MYASISSSAAAPSSSVELDTGDGVETDWRPEPGVDGAMLLMAGDVLATGRETLGLRSLKDLDGVKPASFDESVCESLGAEELLEDIVGADDFLKLAKLWLVGGFFELEAMGTMLGFVPRLID